jgi:hypothetical protein
MGPRELYQRGLMMSALQATRWELVGLGYGDGVWRFRRGVVTRAIMAATLREAIGLLLVQEGCLDPGDVTEAETPPDRRIMGGKPPPPRRPAAVGSRLAPGHKRDRVVASVRPTTMPLHVPKPDAGREPPRSARVRHRRGFATRSKLVI